MKDRPTQIPERYLPVREVGKTYSSISGVYMFHGTPVKFESSLEKDFLVRLSTYDSVLTVISQPLSTKFTALNNREYLYTPDFLVHYKNINGKVRKSELIEVKPIYILRRDIKILLPKFKSAVSCCSELNFIFHIKDEKRIRDQRFKNAKFLKRYIKMYFDDSETNWIHSNLSKFGPMTLEQLILSNSLDTDTNGVSISQIWHLITKSEIFCNMSIELSVKTKFWI